MVKLMIFKYKLKIYTAGLFFDVDCKAFIEET